MKIQDRNISRFGFEQCQKCNICSSVCPMMEVNPLYPGPKHAGPDEERFRMKDPEFFDMALKYCLGCRRCEVACPSGVKVADLVSEARFRHRSPSHLLRNLSLSSTDAIGTLSSAASGVVNRVLGRPSAPVRAALSIAGIDPHRTFPSYAPVTFEKWMNGPEAPSQEGFGRHVAYFHGCYVNYNYPRLGQELVALMNACHYGVRLLEGEKCCGTPLIGNGFRQMAAGAARSNADSILRSLREGAQAVLTTGSSCTFTIRHEYPHLLGIDTQEVHLGLMTATRFLSGLVEEGKVRLVFRKDFRMRAAYHTACHMQRLGWQVYSVSLLKMIPGLDLQILDQECCGMAGTFGFKKENHAYSQAIGSRLFHLIDEAVVDYVICDCETCKWQIEMSTGKKVLNPVSVLYEALDLEATAAANR